MLWKGFLHFWSEEVDNNYERSGNFKSKTILGKSIQCSYFRLLTPLLLQANQQAAPKHKWKLLNQLTRQH
jgi:hypothetical protein